MEHSRASKLDKFLDSILSAQKNITSRNASLFLEAICAQPEPAACISKLVASKNGLESIQIAMCFDLSITFFNGLATTFLQYIQAPGLTTIDNGDLLNQVVLKVVEPPVFWSAFNKAFRSRQLQENGQLCFGWLLLQLISLPGDIAISYREIAQELLDMLLTSPQSETRIIASKIKHVLTTCSSIMNENSPGGRHDNDFADFHDIAILPTADELASTQLPFLRTSAELEDPEAEDTHLKTYFDNQFRLLREDMLYEMREELQIAMGKKKGYHRGLVIEGLRFCHLHWKKEDKFCKLGVALQCQHDLWHFKKFKVKHKDRKNYLMENRKILKHQSLACLIVDNEIVAFATINRDEDLLARRPPVIVLQLEGETSTIRALVTVKLGKNVKLIQIDTAIFSYEPILKTLQSTNRLPLSQELLFWKEGKSIGSVSSPSKKVTQAIIDSNGLRKLQGLLHTPQPIVLDESQLVSLVAGLTQNVSLIQGPPGTGKSFIGALLTKVLHDFTKQTIVVVTYTNHALDQFLEELLNIGIPQSSIVRLGSKSNSRTEALTLNKQKDAPKMDRMTIHKLKIDCMNLTARLAAAFTDHRSTVQNEHILDHLKSADPAYYEAFRVPQTADGMAQIGKKGRAVNQSYLLNRWANNSTAGIFKNYSHILNAREVWGMPSTLRQTRLEQWKQEILKAKAEKIYAIGKLYNARQNSLDRAFDTKVRAVLARKRIISCTTTAAAKYNEDIQAASPAVLLVEEAGEILESHILTAMGEKVKHLILIGDHKQLRPKVNNYMLTVEKGEGYDLNMSLFERLVLKGYPHKKLTKQHRMRPEISTLIRQLTYPDLIDDAKTNYRPQLRGVQDIIVFINHNQPEDSTSQLADRRDMSSTSSKHNSHEVAMVLKIVRYLAQQGYGTENIVILTPYLGQLLKLQEALRKDNDPILNDLDSYDLVRAGLLPSHSENRDKNVIRLATIDNYQGEESDIVIVTLTRSNANNDIGFMSSPERLNVLLSRARDAMILIGNANTFLNARKGKELWKQFFDLLQHNQHIYDGLPVKCERHPDQTAVLSQVTDFDNECPDGGCKEPCGIMLNCGIHKCPSKCHQQRDHSKVACEHIILSKCPRGHNRSSKCHKTSLTTCKKCESRAEAQRKQESAALRQKGNAAQLEITGP